MSDSTTNADEAGRICEITIQPDGRVYVFGICREVLELLDELGGCRDERFRQVLEQVRRAESQSGNPS